MKGHSEEVVKTADVISNKVVNDQGDNLGKIEEIVLAKVSGEARYVVLSFGGVLGMGSKYFALPWKSLSYNPGQKAFVLSIPKEKLAKAPGFDKDHWPDMQQMEWQSNINQYYANDNSTFQS